MVRDYYLKGGAVPRHNFQTWGSYISDFSRPEVIKLDDHYGADGVLVLLWDKLKGL